MNSNTIKHHRSIKAMDPTYPTLPKILRSVKRVENAGHTESVTRGFLGRVKNWEAEKLYREEGIKIRLLELLEPVESDE